MQVAACVQYFFQNASNDEALYEADDPCVCSQNDCLNVSTSCGVNVTFNKLPPVVYVFIKLSAVVWLRVRYAPRM